MRILTYPNEKLTKPSTMVQINDMARNVAMAMKADLMVNGGLGLAAPQIGLNLQVIVVKMADNQYETMFNPVATLSGERITSRESCLSLPGEWWAVPRFTQVSVTYTQHNGNTVNRLFTDKDDYQYPVYIIVQHEVDHLSGVLLNMIGKKVK